MPRQPQLNYDLLARDLQRILDQRGVMSSSELRQSLNISQASFSRLVQRSGEATITLGQGRSTRYASRRIISGVMDGPVDVFEVLPSGKIRSLGQLRPIGASDGLWWKAIAPQAGPSRVFDDLPWFLDTLRPAGFLGRLIPLRYPDLAQPDDVHLWRASDCLRYLTRHGFDAPGAFILGEPALEQALTRGHQTIVDAGDRPGTYASLADDALRGAPPGSSAGGEQPKFVIRRRDPDGNVAAVIIKYSPPRDSAPNQRIGDLLVCEHLALECLREAGRDAAASTIIVADDRVFLEVERFDRVGRDGRRGVISLMAVDNEFGGALGGWHEAGRTLAARVKSRRAVVTAEVATEMAWRYAFGLWIQNTDMHQGNLSFYMDGLTITGLTPTYDMLPMGYMPRQGQVPPIQFQVRSPSPWWAAPWAEARVVAETFWQRVAQDPRVSQKMQKIAGHNAREVEARAAIAARFG